jgi:hypothetical protein
VRVRAIKRKNLLRLVENYATLLKSRYIQGRIKCTWSPELSYPLDVEEQLPSEIATPSALIDAPLLIQSFGDNCLRCERWGGRAELDFVS